MCHGEAEEDHGGRLWQNKVAYIMVARKHRSKSRQEGLGAITLQKHAGTYFLQVGPAFYTFQECYQTILGS